MNIFIYIVALVSLVSSTCIDADNAPDTFVNKGCNYAGRCYEKQCFCCDPFQLNICPQWVCDQSNPGHGCVAFSGDDCTVIKRYFYVMIGIRVATKDTQRVADITCSTVPKDRYFNSTFGTISPSILPQVKEMLRIQGWNGTVVEVPYCDTCSPAYPCTVGIDDNINATIGIGSTYQVDFNSYYDDGCSTGGFILNPDDVPDCPANFDFGLRAYRAWNVIQEKLQDNKVSVLVKQLENSGYTNTEVVGTGFESKSDDLRSAFITIAPTRKPTVYPTRLPSLSPTSNVCGRYTNDVESIAFVGVGANCRAGLNMSWPGGLSCDSPYIVCLPQENTPAMYGGEAYQSSTHRYSISECKQECANDQRCVGLEFVADAGSSLGDCNLIDDLPMKITDSVSGFTYNRTSSYTNLDNTTTNGPAMCFKKTDDICVPHFEADELNEDMLDCYCPNNRKGYYTKKVKRTVSNTRFCGSDLEVDRRIRKAQANRMFHLCENWCLFQTKNPEAESWYWDPWKTCWREQYAGDGEHMSYCTRVIRNPDTIEMQFVNRRSSILCQTQNPTGAPVLASPSWFLAQEEESCDDVCIDNNMVCHEDLTANVTEPNNLSEDHFTDAGVSCSSIAIGELDWAFPGYESSTGACFTRNIDTENTGCNYALGVGYRRLCACI